MKQMIIPARLSLLANNRTGKGVLGKALLTAYGICLLSRAVAADSPRMLSPIEENLSPKIQAIQGSGSINTMFTLGQMDRGIRIYERLPSAELDADFSALGFGVSLALSDNLEGPGRQVGGSFSYTYPVKWFDLSVGVAPVWRHHTKLPDRTDLFIETKFKPIQGIVPSIGYYLNVDGQSSQYTELKLAFPYKVNDRFWISSYWKWGFGDIYTRSFTATHSEFGLDTNYKLSKRFDLMAYTGMSIPFDGAKKFSGKPDPEGFFGFGLRYHF